MIDIIRDFVHGGSVVLIGLIIILATIALIRPRLSKSLFHEFAERKFILVGSIFLCLLSGTVFVATQAPGDNNMASENIKPAQQTVKPMQPAPAEQAVDATTQTDPASQTARPNPSSQAPSASGQPASTRPLENGSGKNESAATQPVQVSDQSAARSQQERTEKTCTAKILMVCL